MTRIAGDVEADTLHLAIASFIVIAVGGKQSEEQSCTDERIHLPALLLAVQEAKTSSSSRRISVSARRRPTQERFRELPSRFFPDAPFT